MWNYNMVVWVLLLPWQWHIPFIRLETGWGKSIEACGLHDMIISWWPSENSFHVCYTWIYPKSFYWIMRNTASTSAAYFVYKLLCKSEYFTSLWFLIFRIWNSISAFNPLGWLFHLNYELKLPTSGSAIIYLPVIFLLYDIGLNLLH